jgi:hypothetical protein
MTRLRSLAPFALAILAAASVSAQNPGDHEELARDADKLRQYILGLRGFEWDESYNRMRYVGEGRMRRVLEVKLKPMGARLAFSPQANVRGSGNPDIDKIALPQFSLNYDPVLGRYWWE